MTSRVLVTGGTGFVGYWMQRTQPATMTAKYLDRRGYDWGDWTDEKWDYFVHLAPTNPAPVLHYAGLNNARMLYCSSGAVYEGTTRYAEDKRKWEGYCAGRAVIARLFSFSGERLKNLYAVTKFVRAALAGTTLEVWGDGLTVRSYLYGEDLGRWMWKILLDGDGIYDVGSAIPYTILDLACIVSELTGAAIKMVGKQEPTVYLPVTKWVNELGCVETVGLREAIERMLDDIPYNR